MVTTFVSSALSHTKGVWRLLEKTNQADIRLAEMENPSLKIAVLLFRVGPCFMFHLPFIGPLN